MKRFRSIAIWTLAAIGLTAAVAVAVRPKPVLVDVVEAHVGKLRVTIDEDGVTRIKERYVVSTPLAGRLERVQLEVGDPVTAEKSVLARMQATDPTLLDPRAVAQAEARVSAAERRLEAARVDLSSAETSFEFAQSEFERAKGLYARKVMAESEFDTKELDYRLRSEEVRGAKFRVDIAEYELELERAALTLTAPKEQDASPGDSNAMELVINSPISGRVLRVYQESSAVLTAGASIMEVGDPNDLEVVADVLSANAVRVAPGAAVWLENWGGDQPLLGKVRIVEPSGFTKTSALGVEEQRVNVIIDFTGPITERRFLGDNFRVDAHIVLWESDAVLKIPTSALFRVQEDWQVFVMRAGKAIQTAVTVGHNNGIEAEILQGLAAGDQVIVHPGDAVSDQVSVEKRP